MSRLLKVAAAAAGTLALTAITTKALSEFDKFEQRRNNRNNNNNNNVDNNKPIIHWPTQDQESNEIQICLDDNGIVDLQRLKTDKLYARSCAIRGFTLVQRAQCWLTILDSENFISLATVRSNNNSNIYQQLVAAEPNEIALQHIAVIKRDVHRTRMIHSDAFDTVESADAALSNVLCAYAKHDTVTGYCQGMNMVVAYMLTQLSEEHAYWMLYTLMTNKYYNLRTIYAVDLNGILLFKYQFAQLFQHYLPDLFNHFAQEEVAPDIFLEMWMTMFTLQAVPKPVCGRIWDLYLVDGFKALHRVTLAILAQSAETLQTFDMEQIIQYIKTLPDHGVLDPDSLIATALSFNVTEQLLDELTQLYEYNLKHPAAEMIQPNRAPVAQAASASTAVRRRNNNPS